MPWRKIIPGFIPIFFVAGYIYVFTDSIIPSLVLETDSGTYREVIGAWYDVTTGLYVLFLILLSWT